VRRTFRYRAYPRRVQDEGLHGQVNEACRLYNAALDERRSAWRMNGVSLNSYDQANQVKVIRAAGDVELPTSRLTRTCCGGSTKPSPRSSAA